MKHRHTHAHTQFSISRTNFIYYNSSIGLARLTLLLCCMCALQVNRIAKLHYRWIENVVLHRTPCWLGFKLPAEVIKHETNKHQQQHNTLISWKCHKQKVIRKYISLQLHATVSIVLSMIPYNNNSNNHIVRLQYQYRLCSGEDKENGSIRAGKCCIFGGYMKREKELTFVTAP